MRDIDIIVPHELGIDGGRRAAKELLHRIVDDRGYDLGARWQDDALHVRGDRFKARVYPHADHLRVSVDLDWPLKPFQWCIQRRLASYVKDHLESFAATVTA